MSNEIQVVGAALDLAIGAGVYKSRNEAMNVSQCFGIVEAKLKQCEANAAELAELKEALKEAEAKNVEPLSKPGPEQNKKVKPPQHKQN